MPVGLCQSGLKEPCSARKVCLPLKSPAPSGLVSRTRWKAPALGKAARVSVLPSQ